MILVRNVFRLKFGAAREAMAVWKSMREHQTKMGWEPAPRLLADLVGPFYTLVMETTHKDLADWEATMRGQLGDKGMHALYEKFTPLVESGYREIFTIQEM